MSKIIPVNFHFVSTVCACIIFFFASSSFSYNANDFRKPRLAHRSLDSFSCSNQQRPIILIPSVKKGLNNQRMRIVQDVASAYFLNASIILPNKLHSRENCHFKADCFKGYVEGAWLWDTYLEPAFMEVINRLAVSLVHSVEKECVNIGPARRLNIRKTYPSHLLESVRDGLVPGMVYTLGDEHDCCTKFIPTTERAVEVLNMVNAGLQSSIRIKKIAHSVKEQVPKLSPYVAVHWRGEEDFRLPPHRLDMNKYTAAMRSALRSSVDVSRLRGYNPKFFFLGDFDQTSMKQILQLLQGDVILKEIEAFTKLSAMPDTEWNDLFDGMDDIKGQVDFELGLSADAFVGSPFSSFSILLERARAHSQPIGTQNANFMARVDVAGRLAEIFSVQFPLTTASLVSDPCARLIQLYPGFSRKLRESKCPTLGPSA